MSSSQNWKAAERKLVEIYLKYSIPAKRISRAGNYAVSTYDVEIEGHFEYKSDSKYSIKPFAAHRLIRTIAHKYCNGDKDVAILYTKNYKDRDSYITVDAEHYAKLLSFWLGCKTKEELEAIS